MAELGGNLCLWAFTGTPGALPCGVVDLGLQWPQASGSHTRWLAWPSPHCHHLTQRWPPSGGRKGLLLP